MQKTIKIFLAVLSMAVLLNLSLCSQDVLAIEELSLVPKDAQVVIVLKNNPDDEGISYLMDLFRDRFERREKETKRKSIDEILSKIDPPAVVGGAFLEDEKRPKFVVILTVKGKIDGERKMDVLKDALNRILTKRRALKALDYRGETIIYRDVKAEPGHGEKDLSAYVELADTIAIGSDPNILKSVIDVFQGRAESVAGSSNFKEMHSRTKKNDVFIYVDNSKMDFSNLVRRTEKEQGVAILMSAELLEALSLSLDLVDNDTVAGTITLKTKETASSLKDVEDDAIFFGKAIERTFVNDNIEWLSNVTSEGDKYVILDFDAFGFKPLLGRAILRSKIKIAGKKMEADTPVKIEKVSHLPKVIFVCFVIGTVLTVALFKRKK